MRSVALSVLALLTACSDPKITTLKCEEISTPLADYPWTGPSEQDVLDAVAPFVPTLVTWDELTLNDDEASLSLIPSRTADLPRVVERPLGEAAGPACRPGPELVLDVTFAVQIDGSAVTGDVPGTFTTPMDGSTVYVNTFGAVSLDPTWAALATTRVHQHNPESTIEGWYLTMVYETWEDGTMLALDGRAEGYGDSPSDSVSALWSGHVWEE